MVPRHAVIRLKFQVVLCDKREMIHELRRNPFRTVRIVRAAVPFCLGTNDSNSKQLVPKKGMPS